MSGVRLALETATDRLSVAADRGDPATRLSYAVEGARRHTGALVPLLERTLQDLDATPEMIGLIALADGPGSFTGLRVGATVAKALARAGDAALLVASTLLVRAAAHARPGQRAMAVSSALRGELFAGVWRFGDDRVESLVAPGPVRVSDLDRWPDVDLIVGEGPEEILRDLERARARTVITPARPDAKILLSLVDRPGACRLVEDVAGFEPEYGRPAEAQARWEERHGRPLPDPTGDA